MRKRIFLRCHALRVRCSAPQNVRSSHKLSAAPLLWHESSSIIIVILGHYHPLSSSSIIILFDHHLLYNHPLSSSSSVTILYHRCVYHHPLASSSAIILHRQHASREKRRIERCDSIPRIAKALAENISGRMDGTLQNWSNTTTQNNHHCVLRCGIRL